MMAIGFILGVCAGAIIMGGICLDTMRLMRQGHDQIVARLDARIASLQAAMGTQHEMEAKS